MFKEVNQNLLKFNKKFNQQQLWVQVQKVWRHQLSNVSMCPTCIEHWHSVETHMTHVHKCSIKNYFFHLGPTLDIARLYERHTLDTFYLLFFIYFNKPTQILKSTIQIQTNIIYFSINKEITIMVIKEIKLKYLNNHFS